MDRDKKIARRKVKIKALNDQIDALRKKLDYQNSELDKLFNDHRDYVKITTEIMVDGWIAGQQVSYGRSTSGTALTFEDFIYHCMFAEKMIHASGTWINIPINEYAKKFGITKEEKERLMQKYWHRRKDTIDELLEGYGEPQREMFGTERDFIRYLVGNMLSDFDRQPNEMKKALQYFIFKWYAQNDIKEIEGYINSVPGNIKKMVDELMEHNLKNN